MCTTRWRAAADGKDQQPGSHANTLATIFVPIALDQPLGDLVLRVGKHTLSGSCFDHAPLMHDDDFIADMAHQPEVIGHDHIGNPQVLLQFQQ